MFRTIGFKVSAAIFVVLVLSFIAMQLILNLDFKNTADKMSKSNLNTVSSSVFQTMRMAMNLGDPEKIQEAIEDAKTIEGISDIKIYPSKETIELFEIKDPKISQEKLIIDQFTQPNLISLEQKLDNINHLRLIRPLIADESCIACHANANLGSVLGVMDVYHSLENIEKDIAKTSRSYIVIFTIALIFALVVVLFVLKMVVGNPIMELLSHAKELAQGSGNLRARIRVKGRDEIAKACEYINQFIEKTQKTVSSASLNSKNVEKQSILLNSNAIELNEISTSSHQKIDSSFKLGVDIGADLDEISNLSSDANKANDKSYQLLDRMIYSLLEIDKKVSDLVQNENNLALKIENMVKYAQNIQKATQMMGEIADKTNLLSLNAGIESARAGSYGKGFSVIAEDIRALANNSEEFLHNVELIIKELLESIQEVAKELKENSHSIFSLNENTHLLASSANEVKLCNQDSKNLVTQCTQRIKISQENIQNLLMHMRENVEASGKNEEISKILLQVADELKIVCHNLESELSQFQI
ncbi:methyl-accepting chemotaxis protein [Campylobacter coli]|nr:methyl-accepting chemotaxis protein [Campylobacter coli]EIX0388183.1 HAMP domain-containing protein [Campylobacter coli]EJM3593364.1 HAMP domain-containing protein [Campylobacter coli]EJY7430519.1 HAMP domain-containing protein [Campylobacter coli]EKF6975026.1 HAMP domain-containing protein [Campylobacter coli]